MIRKQYAKPWLPRIPAQAKFRYRWPDRSKYAPHQGARECARRLAQMEAKS